MRLPFVAIWCVCGDLCALEAGGCHRKDGLYRVATSKKVHGGFLQRRRVSRKI